MHFPEVEKILPEFYKQLFQRVNLHLTVGRNQFEIDIRGESEHLKDLVRQQFMQIEDVLKIQFLEVMNKDPLYQLKKVSEENAEYQSQIHVKPVSTEYHFTIRLGKRKKKIPKSVVFEITSKGKLNRMSVVDEHSTSEFSFISEEVDGKFYFKEIHMIYKRNNISKFRKLDIFYFTEKGIRYPKSLRMTELDSQGLPLQVSGHLNPISMIFNSVKVINTDNSNGK